jgi:hypothetical protein
VVVAAPARPNPDDPGPVPLQPAQYDRAWSSDYPLSPVYKLSCACPPPVPGLPDSRTPFLCAPTPHGPLSRRAAA